MHFETGVNASDFWGQKVKAQGHCGVKYAGKISLRVAGTLHFVSSHCSKFLIVSRANDLHLIVKHLCTVCDVTSSDTA